MAKMRLDEIRRARNISQAKMAEICGVHVNTYREWELNPAQIKVSNAIKIADALSVDIDDIIFA